MTVGEEPPAIEAHSPAPIHWRRLHALGLPGGSVRAILAVAVCGAIWAWLSLRPEREVPRYLQDLMFIIMGHYFASRARSDRGAAGGASQEVGPPPLFLPRGTIRFLLVAGFLTVTGLLIYRHRLWLTDPAVGKARLNPAGVTLLLAIGFLVGVAGGRVRQWWADRRKGVPLPRVVEDVRAIVSLAAAAALLLMVFGLWSPEKGNATLVEIKRFFANSHIEEVLAAVVGFYFGSRS
jgi:uncharacterized membrane protein YfcA